MFARLSSESEDADDDYDSGGEACESSEYITSDSEDDATDDNPQTPQTPPTAPARKRRLSTQGRREKEPPISDTAAKRIQACMLVVDGSFSKAEACRIAGISRQHFSSAGWCEVYEHKGINALLHDERTHKRTKVTPRTKSAIEDRAKQGGNAGEILAHLLEVYKERGEDDREPPSTRTVQRCLHDAFKYVIGKKVFLVKSPWHARYVIILSELQQDSND